MLEMANIIRGLSHRHAVWDVFSDFVELSAISISNAVDKSHFDEREARYFEIIKKYKREELEQFPHLLALLVNELESGITDVLGALFHELELHNKYKGQFFTPFHICRMMAKMTGAPETQAAIDDKGYITMCEPCSGSGAMVIAYADEMKRSGINYQKHLHVTAADLDIRCVHMAYVQLSLLHIPAVVVHANTLTLEEYIHWYTPAHILGFWEHKIRKDQPQGKTDTKKTPAPQPALSRSADIQLDLFGPPEAA